MNLRRRDHGDPGDFIYGLSSINSGEGTNLAGNLVVVPSQMAYLHIPATELRNFVDGLFPNLATNRIADSAVGFGHRYRAGHDLLLDVPATFNIHGTSESLRHAGHIIFTDFPTKAGIPIPGFSQSGLGSLIEQVGISRGWLQLSLFDTGVGIFVFADGASALTQALQGTLSMDFSTACQTFGVGTAELGFALATQNPLLLAGGMQNILAGLVSTWNTYSVYIDPLDLLGIAGTSAILGFGIAQGLMKKSLSDASLNAARSGAIGALYSISTAFGFGVLTGFVASRLCSALAKQHNISAQNRLSVDRHSYRLLINELCSGTLRIQGILQSAEPKWIRSDPMLQSSLKSVLLPSSGRLLPASRQTFNSHPHTFNTEIAPILSKPIILPDDPSELLSLYQRTA